MSLVQKCEDYIIKIYRDEKINNFISKIHPRDIQDDLRQELAVILMEYDCDRLIEMSSQNSLLSFAFKIIYNLTNHKRNNFNKTYLQNRHLEITDYNMSDHDEGRNELLDEAQKFFEKKSFKNANELHEFYIFEKYLEFGNQSMVAKYFDIPKMHVSIVVNNVRKELKNKLKKCI